jgi:hypothetical protein
MYGVLTQHAFSDFMLLLCVLAGLSLQIVGQALALLAVWPMPCAITAPTILQLEKLAEGK